MKTFVPYDGSADLGFDGPSKRRLARVIRRKLVAQGMLVQQRVSDANPLSVPKGPLRVLIADDYADAAESLAMLLELAGLETSTATRGDEALRQAIKWRPHVCVLDIDMPGCNGRD